MLPAADCSAFFKSGYINKTNHQSINHIFRSPDKGEYATDTSHHLPSVPRYFCKQGFSVRL